MKNPEDILQFWFGELDDEGLPTPEIQSRWYKKDPNFDEEIRSKFLSTYQQLADNPVSLGEATPQAALATILVYDQFSRNMFRDSPQMYATDPQALEKTLDCVAQGWDKQLAVSHRVFVYMPLMHSEDLVMQETCVQLFTAFSYELKGQAKKKILNNVVYAEKHRDIIAQFGRFPHRNTILGRQSSPEEQAFLQQPGSSF